MGQFSDFFNPKVIFSTENPFLKTAKKAHLQLVDSFEKAARLQLSFAEDLLDLNRKRINVLYSGESFSDLTSAQQDIITEVGKRTATWAGDLREVVVDYQSGLADAANDLISPASAATRTTKKKKKAA